MAVDWKLAQVKAAKTARWAVTMTKVRIRHVLSRTRWQLVTFCGKAGGESVGVVDLLAVRKDHGKPIAGTKRGDALQIILIQVKGGSAANAHTRRWEAVEDGCAAAPCAAHLACHVEERVCRSVSQVPP
jgi:hypothetical protein